MEKLTIKELAPYLPYGLKGLYDLNKWQYTNGLEKSTYPLQLNSIDDFIEGFYKPILRPLSDLTKEIEVDGDKFVAASQMITHGFHDSFWYDLETGDYRYLYTRDLEKLLEWHFDVFGLIEKGLAIDINTLKS